MKVEKSVASRTADVRWDLAVVTLAAGVRDPRLLPKGACTDREPAVDLTCKEAGCRPHRLLGFFTERWVDESIYFRPMKIGHDSGNPRQCLHQGLPKLAAIRDYCRLD